jgi:cytochrome c oxidase subunit 2
MRGRVIVLAPADYARWLAGHDAPQLATIGERVAADKGCLRCHTVDGAPHLGPTWRGLYGSRRLLADGTSVVADEAYLTESMMDPSVKIVAGYPPIMPTYLGKLTAPEAAAIVEFIRSLR